MKRFLSSAVALALAVSMLLVPAASAAAPAAAPAPKKVYVSLGDSVAAGAGLESPANPTEATKQCGRSPQAYSQIVARRADMRLKHIACSGATMGDLFTKQGVDGPNITAQLDRAFAGAKPDLITITAGANDAHWSEFIKACYQFDCTSAGYTAAANYWLLLLQGKMYAAYADIYLRSGGSPPQVIVTGYYDPFSSACAKQQSYVTDAEIRWLQAETAALNATIRDVSSSFPWVKYVPVDFTGHDICSSDPWVQGAGDAAPFHPTAKGQRVIARSVLSSIGY